jgi:hypothetical protein
MRAGTPSWPRGLFQDLQRARGLFEEMQRARRVFEDLQRARGLFEEMQRARQVFEDVQRAQGLFKNLQLPRNITPNIQMAQGVFQDLQRAQALFGDLQQAQGLFKDIQRAQNLFKDMQLIFPSVQLAKSFLAQVNDWPEFATVFETSETLPDTIPGTSLSRAQKRFLFGYFVYSIVLSLCMLAVLRLMEGGEIDAEALTLLTATTGWGGLSIAKAARDVAFRIFDSIYPPNEP